jgi:hypothetical protein
MLTIKNRYQKVIYRIKKGEVVNQSGNKIGEISEDYLINTEGEKVAKVEGQQVKSVDGDNVLADLSGTTVSSPEGSVLGYVDGKPFNQFIYGAAVLAVFTY